MSNSEVQERAKLCEALWQEKFSLLSAERNYSSLLAEWEKVADRCKGTGIYEIKLASTQLMLDQYQQARQIMENLDVPAEYGQMAETVKLNVDYMQLLSLKGASRQQFETVESTALAAVKKYPMHLPLYSVLGHIEVILGKYAQAAKALEKAVQQSGDLTGPYRNLTIAYARIGNYSSALDAASEAHSRYKGITSDEEFMYAVSISYAATDNVEAAKDTLTIILNKKPYLQNDERFRKAVQQAKELSGGKLK